VRGFDNRKRPGFSFNVTVETAPLPRWDSLSEADREELDFRRAMYAAQVDRLDQNVGRIVERLEKHGILDNTLILFFADNGCSGELGRFGMNWGKYTRANYQEWRKKGGWSVSQGQCWASYSNTPLRKYKIYVHEGGIASPFIAHWPKGIAEPGRIVREQMFHLIDIMPTLCDVAGATYPRTFEGRPITPAQGVSMVPFLTGADAEVARRTLFWQHEVNAAVREGDWKLVTVDDRDDGKWELYNLATDRSETEDLIARHPDIADRLKKAWRRWAEETNVLPFPEDRGLVRRNPWPPPPWPEGR
jgi:arylsulfatase